MSDPSDHRHDHDRGDDAAMFTRAFWDERYAASDRVWSGNPNPRLVENVADLAPGRALDVGCGEGADAVWLAGRGWQVTGVDVSQVALDRAARHAADAGLGEQTSWAIVDLVGDDPLPGGFDLVSAQFMHLPASVFAGVYGAIADSVRPGGSLLVVGHHPADSSTGLRNERLSHLLFTPEQVLAVVADLAGSDWEIRVADTPTRRAAGPDGDPVTVTDTVVLARRR